MRAMHGIAPTGLLFLRLFGEVPLRSGRRDYNNAAFYTGDGTFDEEKLFRFVDGDDCEMADAGVFIAHLSRHVQSAERTTGSGAGADGTHRAVEFGAVAHRTATGVVALDRALEAFTDGATAYVDEHS